MHSDSPGLRPGHFRAWLIALVLVNLLARLPLVWEPAAVRNDGAEYLAIARSLRTSGEYATDLKYHFWTDDPVRHPAWADRPPLYPFLAALTQGALSFLDPTAAARLGNAVLACLALALGALWLRRLYGETAALFAAGYVFLLPHTLYWTAQPMTEAVSLALSLGALMAWRPGSGALWATGGWGSGAPVDGGSMAPRGRGERCTTEAASCSPRARGPMLRRSAEGGSSRGAARPSVWGGLGAGVLAGLTYLARPTGGLLLIVFLLDAVRRGWVEARRPGVYLAPAAGCVVGFGLCALPYHLLLWRVYGNPLHSSIGYTFSIGTYYEVTYHGFEREMPGTLEFLRERWTELPSLLWRQWQAHASALVLPLLGLWPLALFWRRGEWSGERWTAGALVLLSILLHAAVWSAWGSSRYFLLPILILTAALGKGEVRMSSVEGAGRRWLLDIRKSTLALRAASALGLAVVLVGFYRTELRADAGLPMLPMWKEAAREVRGAALVASDRPQTLNLLAEVPAVMLPRTTDPEKLERFVRKYEPEVMLLFIQEPLLEEAEAQAAAWRRGELPPGWRLMRDTGRILIALRSDRRGGTEGDPADLLP